MASPMAAHEKGGGEAASEDADADLPERIRSLRSTFMHQADFDETFLFLPPPKVEQKARKCARKLFYPFFSVQDLFRFVLSFIPALEWIPRYSCTHNLLGDLMAGITVGIMHVPQGIAYAILAGVDPVYGLYSSFFPVLCYAFFGTSRHVSIGSFAVVSMMSGTSRERILEAIHLEHLHDEGFYVEHAAQLGYTSVNIRNLTSEVPLHIQNLDGSHILATLTLCVGFIQLMLAFLRAEFLASYLSDQLVSGFITGASVHVAVVQLENIFQVDVENKSGPGEILLLTVRIIGAISRTNISSLVISAFCFAFLFVGKDCLNTRLRAKLGVQLPVELLLVMVSTGASRFFDLKDTQGLRIVSRVPIGFPSPRLPRFDLIPYVFKDALEIAFVIVAVHLSMCKVFNRRHSYKTDNNQELYALGLVGVTSSFFSAYPVATALGRSLVAEESGCKTQLSGLFSSAVVLVVILRLGSLLCGLPLCTLSVIIMFSLKNVFRKSSEIRELWTVSKVDFAIFMVSFVGTVLTDVMWGLLISVCFALMTTVFRTQWPRWRILSRLAGTDDYRDCGRYARVDDVHFVRIFRFDSPLLFTNVDHFRLAVERASLECSMVSLATLDHILETDSPVKHSDKPNLHLEHNFVRSLGEMEKRSARRVEHFIIDCSGFTFIDFMSVNALIEVYEQMRSLGVNIYFAGAKAPIRDMFEICGFYNSVSRERFYPTVHDAVQAATFLHQAKLYRQEKEKKSSMEGADKEDSNGTGNKALQGNAGPEFLMTDTGSVHLSVSLKSEAGQSH